MRTTLDLNDNLMRRIRRKAMDENKSLKEIINRTLADSLERDKPEDRKNTAYTCPTFSMGEPMLDLNKALHLSDQLEDQAVTDKLELRK